MNYSSLYVIVSVSHVGQIIRLAAQLDDVVVPLVNGLAGSKTSTNVPHPELYDLSLLVHKAIVACNVDFDLLFPYIYNVHTCIKHSLKYSC